ncbi:hypothetical protein GUJ93_ZPchr0008g13758 [Zizania palustris]|uniref:RING-type domain-containing protein n=1 Tax=Zizania palustris TaxID=103762 RepID=A0A8J5VI42_ZIZPA|nr:hypothetical protein GUJ93_ZPchr0008g13758 [Zizania palustris]
MAPVDAATSRNDDEDQGDAVGMAPVLDAADSSSASGANDGEHQHHHIVIDIDDDDDDDAEDSGSTTTGSDDAPCCVVCAEPLEHVAVGRCGHRTVCPLCAARIRYGPPQSRRCCICRTVCPTVVVTNTAAAAAIDAALFTSSSNLPDPVSGLDERLGEYWYCAVISAYFDDEQQYEAVAAFLKRPPPQQQQPPCPNVVAANLDEAPWQLPPGLSWRGHAAWFLVTVVFFALIGASLALVTMHGDRVARATKLAAVWALLAALAYILLLTLFHCFYRPQP